MSKIIQICTECGEEVKENEVCQAHPEAGTEGAISDYDPDKSMAILSGIICGLIALAGTTLGGYDAISKLGFLGILCVCCYIILDSVNAWAIYLDYKEDGTALEYASWTVKLFASLFLLAVGGLIGHRMMTEAKDGGQMESRQSAFNRTYQECIKQNPKALANCRKLAESSLQTEADLSKEAKAESLKGNETYEKILNWPFFHYVPGMLGVLLFAGLSLIKKITGKKRKAYRKLTKTLPAKPVSLPESLPEMEVSFSDPYGKLTEKAYFDTEEESKRSERFYNASKKDWYTLIRQEEGYQIRDKGNQYLDYLGKKAYAEMVIGVGITYAKLKKYLQGRGKA